MGYSPLAEPVSRVGHMSPGSQKPASARRVPDNKKPLSKASCLAIWLLEAMALLECTGAVAGFHHQFPAHFVKVTMRIVAT